MKYIIVIIGTSLLLSCSTQSKSSKAEVSDENTKAGNAKTETTNTVNQLHDIWALEEISNTKIEEIDKFIRRPILELYVKEMRVVGNDGCNQFSGTIKELTNNSILFSTLMGTRMACKDMGISDKFNTAMSEVTAYKREGLKLILLDKEGVELLQFRKID